MSFKQEIHTAFSTLLSQKITALEDILAGIKESVSNETKSTAGDKHETARAHLQIEQEQTGRQLQELLLQQAQLNRLNPATNATIISPGSLITTDKSIFYMSMALGKLIVNGKTIISLSPQSPLGTKLTGQKAGDRIEMNGVGYLIVNVE